MQVLEEGLTDSQPFVMLQFNTIAAPITSAAGFPVTGLTTLADTESRKSIPRQDAVFSHHAALSLE
jgi:hypothetical protein